MPYIKLSKLSDLVDRLKSRLLNPKPVQSLPMNTATVTLIPEINPSEKQSPSTSSIVVTLINLAALVTLMVFVFILLYQSSLQVLSMKNPRHIKQSGKCVLPAHPEHGAYMHAPAAKPGERFESLNLTVVCLPGYGVLGTDKVYCQDGTWSDFIPKCIRFCKLDTHPSVNYHCHVSGSTEDYRACNAYEPPGSVVWPECNSPNYYSVDTLRSMKCIDGSWDRVVLCSPDCGRVTQKGVPLIADGRPAEQGELPWHVGIYRKNMNPYMQICGGSIISSKLVISAAHCFWSDVIKLLPASEFAVAAGKIYRSWNNPRDMDAQKSDVKEIKIPDHFQGGAANFQADIAVIIVKTEFIYTSLVRPICLNFDVDFETRQLQPGKLGKVAGWGLTAENAKPSKTLKVIDMPYMGTKECIAESPPTFSGFITSDKICAGYKNKNGSAIGRGDGGGGLAFPTIERGKDRYYLRGIVSTAPINDDLSYSKLFVAFTHILKHENFVMDYF